MFSKVTWLGIASSLFFVLLSIATVKAATDPGDPNSAASGSAGSGQSAIGSDPNSADPNPSLGGSTLSQTAISGTLERVSDNSLSLKTTDGETKDYTIKSEKMSQIKSIGLKKGDRVVAQVDAQNQVVEVTRMGTGG